MFRMGGNTDQGIMSGVVPRQGYYRGKTVGDLGSMTIGELEDMARASTRGDRRAAVSYTHLTLPPLYSV